MEKISFIGCGSWGGALSKILSDKGIYSIMWHRNKAIIDEMSVSKRHYLVPELTFSVMAFAPAKNPTLTSSLKIF